MSCGKINYDTYRAAKIAANGINNRPHNKKVARVYQCGICKTYHITSSGIGQKASVRKEKTKLRVVKFRK